MNFDFLIVSLKKKPIHWGKHMKINREQLQRILTGGSPVRARAGHPEFVYPIQPCQLL